MNLSVVLRLTGFFSERRRTTRGSGGGGWRQSRSISAHLLINHRVLLERCRRGRQTTVSSSLEAHPHWSVDAVSDHGLLKQSKNEEMMTTTWPVRCGKFPCDIFINRHENKINVLHAHYSICFRLFIIRSIFYYRCSCNWRWMWGPASSHTDLLWLLI